MTFIPKVNNDSLDNGNALRATTFVRNFGNANYDDFWRLSYTNLGDTSTTNYAGADLIISEKAIHFAGTESGTPGQLYSLSLNWMNISKEMNMNTINSPTVVMQNPTSIIGTQANFDNFYVVSFGKGGATAAYAYRGVVNPTLGFGLSLSISSGAEDWSGARACVIPKSWSTASAQNLQVYYWTAPLADKVYARGQFGSVTQSTTFAGETPTAICADANGYIWVSFTGSGKIRQYKTGDTNSDFYVLTLLNTFNIAGVQELLFDGKYVWAFSSATANGTVYKIDANISSAGIISQLALSSSLGSTAGITAKSRACFSGTHIYLTRQNSSGNGGTVEKFDAGRKDITLVVSYGPGGQPRGIVADKNGYIYLASYNGTTINILLLFPKNSELPIEPYESTVVWGLNRYGMPKTFNFWNKVYVPASPDSVLDIGEVEFDIYAFKDQPGGAHYARFKFLVNFQGATWGTPYVTVNNIIAPIRVGDANTFTWDVTFSIVSNAVVGTITQGADTSSVIFHINTKFKNRHVEAI